MIETTILVAAFSAISFIAGILLGALRLDREKKNITEKEQQTSEENTNYLHTLLDKKL